MSRGGFGDRDTHGTNKSPLSECWAQTCPQASDKATPSARRTAAETLSYCLGLAKKITISFLKNPWQEEGVGRGTWESPKWVIGVLGMGFFSLGKVIARQPPPHHHHHHLAAAAALVGLILLKGEKKKKKENEISSESGGTAPVVPREGGQGASTWARLRVCQVASVPGCECANGEPGGRGGALPVCQATNVQGGRHGML